MNWNKAKNYTILLLIILNICLLGLNFEKSFSGRLSGTDVNNIIKVLEENNISVETGIPKSSRSLPQLELGKGSFDLFELVSVFFGSDIGVRRTEEFNVTIFKSGSKTLKVKDRTVIYNDSEISVEIRAEAEEIAKGYMERLDDMFPGFVHSTTDLVNTGIRVEYDMYYKNNNCFNNSCTFDFNEEGLTITLRYSEPKGFSGVKSKLYNSDIILFSFMNKIREFCPGESFTITEISLGYFANFNAEPEEVYALPYYRIRVKENNDSYYINGYTANFVGSFSG